MIPDMRVPVYNISYHCNAFDWHLRIKIFALKEWYSSVYFIPLRCESNMAVWLREKVVVNILVDTYCIAKVAIFWQYFYDTIEKRKLQTPTCFYRVLNRFLQDGFKLIVICWSIGNLQINCILQIIRLYKLHHFSVTIQVKVYTFSWNLLPKIYNLNWPESYVLQYGQQRSIWIVFLCCLTSYRQFLLLSFFFAIGRGQTKLLN